MNDKDFGKRGKGKGKGCLLPSEMGLYGIVWIAVGGLAGCASAPAVTASSAAALCQLAHSRLPTDAPEKAAEALAKCSDPAYIEPWLEEFDDVKALVKAQRAGKPRP